MLFAWHVLQAAVNKEMVDLSDIISIHCIWSKHSPTASQLMRPLKNQATALRTSWSSTSASWRPNEGGRCWLPLLGRTTVDRGFSEVISSRCEEFMARPRNSTLTNSLPVLRRQAPKFPRERWAKNVPGEASLRGLR